MDRNSNKNRSFLICLLLALIILAVFYQVYSFSFVNFDDPAYIYKNPNIQTGITVKTIEWACATGYAANWHPLTWLSHILDWQLFGSNPAGHHITNLIFHIANTLLLFFVLKQMTNAIWQSAFVAALFALHPLHVESVAWVTERKDVLSAFFWLLTMWAYVRYVKNPKLKWYLILLILFALGLMSKPMLVTLPFVLLLLDYWPLNRFKSKRSPAYLVVEKIPLFAMVIASSIVTFIVQKKGGAVAEIIGLPLKFRICNALISYGEYISKMIWPSRLAVFYPHPGFSISFFYAAISAVFLLAVTIIVFRLAKNHKYLVTGWFWYIGTLVPVIGLIQIGNHAMADRYSYITLTGLFIIIAWGMPQLLIKWRYKKIAFVLSATLIILAMSICTHFQLRYWRNSLTLFQHTLDVTKNNYVAHLCIADALFEQNKLNEALYHYSEVVRLQPASAAALKRLATSLCYTGKADESVIYYERAIKIEPNNADTYNNLGVAFCMQGKFDQAIPCFNRALQINPQYVGARDNLIRAEEGIKQKPKIAEDANK